MSRSRVLAAAALAALAAAAPASAIGGGAGGASAALHAGRVLQVTVAESRPAHTCQAHSDARASASQAARKFAPVACEQPPRSSLVTPDALAKAVATAVAALG